MLACFGRSSKTSDTKVSFSQQY